MPSPTARRNRFAQPPRMEALEPRLLLSGNVEVELKGGALCVTGDDQANDIVIEEVVPGGGRFRVSSGADPTTINGGAGPVELEPVTGGVKAKFGGGDDDVQINAATVPGDLKFKASAGLSLGLDAVQVEGKVDVKSGEGPARFEAVNGSGVTGDVSLKRKDGGTVTTIDDSMVFGSIKVKNGAGADALALRNGGGAIGDVKVDNGAGSGAPGSHLTWLDGAGVDGRLDVKGADGDSHVIVENASLVTADLRHQAKRDVVETRFDGAVATSDVLIKSAGDTQASVVDGGQVVGELSVKAKAGETDVDVTGASYVGGIDLKTKGTRTELLVSESTVGGDIAAKIKTPVTEATLWDAAAGSVDLRTGDGDDLIRLFALVTADEVSVDTGGGHDDIRVDDTDVLGRLSLDTGDGFDLVQIERNVDPGVSTFAGDVEIDLGDDDDVLLVGVPGDAGRLAVFGGAAEFDGGKGNDIANDLADPATNTFLDGPPEIEDIEGIV